MSTGFKLELNRSGVGELLKSSELTEALEAIGTEIAASCGEGYSVNKVNAGTRGIVIISTETEAAYQDNLENDTLLHALGG